ncbi:MAG: O-antigen ligase family protein [Chloroflexi bacterium]|nr:MAG: O-antigen ligase family protein [Chloroflexota bacterium]
MYSRYELASVWYLWSTQSICRLYQPAVKYCPGIDAGEIAIAVATLFIVIVGLPHLRKLIALLALAGLGAVEVFFAGWIPEYVLTPLFKYLGLTQISFVNPGSADFSTAERLAHWIAGVHMFLNHPLIGVGIGNYPDAYPGYFITIFVNSLGHAHNYYINIAAETGSIGLTAYLLFLMAIFVTGGSAFQAISKNILKNDRALAIGLLAALISVCIHNLVDDLYVHSLTNLMALLLIVLIRLEGVTTKVGGTGGYIDYKQPAK